MSDLTPNLPAPPQADRIAAAHATIDPVFLDTPLLRHPAADAALGFGLLAKVETLNPIRSFKGRGTDWFLAGLPPADGPLVAASAGNFGQGLAYAAARRGRKAVVFSATTANPLKVEAMRRLGAEVVLTGNDFDAAKAAARRFAAERGGRFVEDGAEPAIAEGAGTLALELTRELERRGETIEAILVPLGNGALLTGVGAWIKAKLPSCRVVGVVAEAAPSMLLSWREGRTVPTASAGTIADGIAVREPVPYAVACLSSTVDEIRSVTEESIRAAMRFCHEHFGLVIEPAGAAGLAVALEYPADWVGKRLATVLCGSNLTPAQVREYLC